MSGHCVTSPAAQSMLQSGPGAVAAQSMVHCASLAQSTVHGGFSQMNTQFAAEQLQLPGSQSPESSSPQLATVRRSIQRLAGMQLLDTPFREAGVGISWSCARRFPRHFLHRLLQWE